MRQQIVGIPIMALVCPTVSPVDTASEIAAVLERDIDSDALNVQWLSEVIYKRDGVERSSLSITNLFEEGWQEIIGVSMDDATDADVPLLYAAYVWLFKVANRWEEWIGDGTLTVAEADDACWQRGLMRDTLIDLADQFGFPRPQCHWFDGIARRAIEWIVDDARFNLLVSLAA